MSAVLALRKQVAEQRCYTTDFSAGKNNINGLPRDMLVKIMMQADVRETVVFAQVCSQWQRAAADTSLWRHFCVREWGGLVDWSTVDEVTEDFLEEYQWRRLFREICELQKCETVMTTQSAELRANASIVRRRLDESRSSVARAVDALKLLSTDERGELAALPRDAGSEAVGCATMILVRGEPSWAEVIRNASQDALVGKAVGCDLDNITPGMLHRVSRLSTRPDFAAVMMKHQGGTARPHALGALAEWVVACQEYGAAARELIPKQELVDKAEKSLPDRIQDYEKARNELEEVIGEGCFFNNPCPGC